MQIRLLETIAEIDAIHEDWERLFIESCDERLFCSFAWVRNSYAHNTEVQPLLLAAYADNQRLVGVFPFAIREMKFRWLSLKALVHGSSERADYASFLVSAMVNERVVVNRAVKRLAELQREGRWVIYAVNNLSEADGRTSLFREFLGRETFGGASRSAKTFGVLLQREFEEAKKLSNIKRRFRKLAESAEVTTNIDVALDQALLERMAALHARAFPGAAFGSARGQPFFRGLLEDPVFSKHIQVSTIEAGGTLIAAHFGFHCQGKLFYYVPMFDASYAQYGPGQYLLWRMLAHFRDAGFREFDFLRGDEDYKYQWANTSACNYRIWAAGSTAPWWIKGFVSWLLVKECLAAIRRSRPG